MEIQLVNQTGQMKCTKVGISWTTFFFGIFVPMFRGDWIGALIMLGVNIITCGLAGFVWPFIYNKIYIDRLLGDGYRAANQYSYDILIAKGFISASAQTYNPQEAPTQQEIPKSPTIF